MLRIGISTATIFFLLTNFIFASESGGTVTVSTADSRINKADYPSAPELSIKPWRILGTNKADATAASINPPDGLAFTPDGLLLVTDAQNHRIQIFDPTTGKHIGSFGNQEIFPGEVVAIAVKPNGDLWTSDEVSTQVRAFTRIAGEKPSFLANGPARLNNAGFKRLTGIACDSASRLYAVDSLAGEVRRYLPDFTPDPSWKFPSYRPNGKPMLYRADGIVLHEKSNTLFVTSERDGMIMPFDLKSGRWLGKTIGRQADPVSANPTGTSVFSRSVEGLAVFDDYLLAVDEGYDEVNETGKLSGRLFVFQLNDPAIYETGAEHCRMRMAQGKIAGFVGWWGDFLSPDGVAAFPGNAEHPDSLVAIADQGRYRVLVYRGADLLRAIHSAATKTKL